MMKRIVAILAAFLFLTSQVLASDWLINSYRFAVSGPLTIILVGTPTTGNANNGANITLTLPTGLAENDVVYVHHVITISTGGGGTSSSGWTQIGADLNNAGNHRTQVFRKVMGASPDASIVLVGTGGTSDGSCAQAWAFRGVSTSTPEDVTQTTATNTTGEPDSPSITPSTTGATALIFGGSQSTDDTITAPSGYSNATAIAAGESSGVSYGAWKAGLTGGVAENPAIFGGASSARWTAWTIAVRPGP